MYDFGKNYFECLKQILIERRKLSKPEIVARFPIFAAKFPEMIEILHKKNITYKDVVKQGQKALYDDDKTFAQCVYELLSATSEFDAIGKRKTSMPDWVAWYENIMNTYPIFYEFFKTLMRNICEGRTFTDQVICMLIVSVEMEHRGVISREQRAQLFDEFVTRKGIYARQISHLKITEDEWSGGVQEFFDQRRDEAIASKQ